MSAKCFRVVALIAAAFLLIHPTRAGAPPLSSLHLMPMPKSLELRQGKLPVDSSFSICLTGQRDPRIPAAAERFLQHLQKRTGIPLPLPLNMDSQTATLEIHCIGTGEQIQSVNTDESYALDVTARNARLDAPTPVGILRGLETLLQLLDLDERSYFMPAVQIRDEPRFRWRGLLLDVSRHWEPVDIIKRNLDAMAAFKMNVFHWHLSDDQGFRIESRTFPKLHQIGSEGNYYTQAEVREIIAYARERGIRVVPEFDMPGHTTALLVAYPELASAPGPYQIERSWGVFDPCMDPTSKKVYSFLNSFIGEMAGIFPDEYFHIGGDEVSGKQWTASSKIQTFKTNHGLKNNAALQAYFNRRLQKILARHDKKMIGWDEILHQDLPKSVVVQSWRGHSYLAKSAIEGYAGLLSYGYYLDHMRPASFHYANDPMGKECATLSAEEKSRIYGGEACMWGEFVTPDNIESRIWPRTAAIAERLWSPSGVRDVQDMYRRLEFADRELDLMGLMHRANNFEMLQRMIGSVGVEPLKIFATLLRPTSLSIRRKSRDYSSLVPLNRMADAVLPESDSARRFGDAVNGALADQTGTPDAFQQVREQLAAWNENAKDIRPALEESFLLKEIGPLSEIVAELTDVGLEALDHLAARQRPTAAWKDQTASILQRAEKPQAEMMIAIVVPVKKLVEAASALP